MKKFACLLFALVICLSSVALAESVPSKTTGDLTTFEVVAENLPADSALVVRPVADTEAAYQKQVNACQAEINKLATESTIEAYFGEVKDTNGNAIVLKEVLGTETLNVFEFCPFVVEEYKAEYGNVVTKMNFSTPYEKGEKVVVLIGLVTVNADGTQTVEWVAFEGIGAEEGGIEVELDSQIMMAVQNGTAIMTVVSK